jgi:hypothetical protein
MMPFQSNLSQYIADLYASTSYYQPIYVYPNQDNCWSALSYPDHPATNPAPPQYDFEIPQKTEDPTKTNTRVKRPREKVNQESSASCQSGEDES